MRVGCDGSRDTLHTRKLITEENINCHRCGVIETRQHILESCDIYNAPRRKMQRDISRDQDFT